MRKDRCRRAPFVPYREVPPLAEHAPDPTADRPADLYADLHVHSKHSRACSRDADLEHLAWWAARKGLGVIGTGDFQHPVWRTELAETLVEAEPGLHRLRPELERDVLRRLPGSCRTPARFLLSTEISTIYKRDGRTRKVHHLVYAPDLGAAGRITAALERVGNLAADGRPILGLDSRDLLDITLSAGEGCFLVPAHIWTPWFAALGSKSGFDSIADCYADLADHIFAVETGLSSDPAMNWQVSSLDRYRLVSNSDAHSPPILGREATVFSTGLDYGELLAALRQDGPGFVRTINFFPEEGRYHLDGHRNCGVRQEPAVTRARGEACPTCGKPVTVGVQSRVEALADRPAGYRPGGADPYRSLIQLPQVVGEIRGVGPKSQTVGTEVARLVDRLGPELAILERVPLDALADTGGTLLAEAVGRLRRGEVTRVGGYDGEYGVVRLFDPQELAPSEALFDLAPAEPTPTPDAAAPTPDDGSGLFEQPLEVVPPSTVVPPARDVSVLDGLDPDQRTAAAHEGGPLLIVAGPGTGKTRTLTHLLAYRIAERGLPPERALAVTFTRRAAGELRERLADLVPGAADRVAVATFSGLGLRIVREQVDRLGLPPSPRVADDATRYGLLRDLGLGNGHLRRLATAVGAAKRDTVDADPTAAALLPRYDAALRERGLVDLDDLLTLPVSLLAGDPDLAAAYRERWPLVCVDEYQDVDELQYRLLGLLTAPDGDLVAIGDPDQAIYGFRGADVGFFLRFLADHPGARSVALTRNYRSTPTIVRGALRAVARSTLVPDRVLDAVGGHAPDVPIVAQVGGTEQDEAEGVARTVEELLGGTSFGAIDAGEADAGVDARLSFADIAVLYRTARQARPLLEAFGRRGFPVQQRSHDRLGGLPGVVAVADVLRGQAEADPSPAPVTARLRRAVQTVLDVQHASLGASEDPVAEVQLAAELLAPLAAEARGDLDRFFADVALGAGVDVWDPRADRISLLTLHAAKGLEFPVVFVVGCEDGLLPLRWPGRPSDTDEAEERRLFFVGMTRATSQLVLTRARRRRGDDAERRPSPFLADLGGDLVAATPGRPRRNADAVQLRLV